MWGLKRTLMCRGTSSKWKYLFLPVQKGKTKHLTAAGLPNFILMCVSYSMPRHSPIACVLMLLPGSQERQNMRRKIMACAIKIATKIWCFGEEERLSWKWLSTLENWLIYGRIRFREKKQSNFLRATILPHNLQLSFPCKMAFFSAKCTSNIVSLHPLKSMSMKQ